MGRRIVGGAMLSVALITGLWAFGWWRWCCNRPDYLASWVQSAGSLIALALAVALYAHQCKSETDRKARVATSILHATRTIVRYAETEIGRIAASAARPQACLLYAKHRGNLQRIATAIDRIPIHELPFRAIDPVMNLRASIDEFSDALAPIGHQDVAALERVAIEISKAVNEISGLSNRPELWIEKVG